MTAAENTTGNASVSVRERRRTMNITQMGSTSSSIGRISAAAVFLGVATLLAGCANPDGVTTGSLPDDYRTRHPIVIAEAQKTIDIPIAAGDRKLTRGQSEVIAGFAAEYQRSSKGIIQIVTPNGAMNSGAAASRSEAHTSALQSLMGISYAVF